MASGTKVDWSVGAVWVKIIEDQSFRFCLLMDLTDRHLHRLRGVVGTGAAIADQNRAPKISN